MLRPAREGGAGPRCSGPGRAIDAAAAARCRLRRSGPRARCRSGPARNPHPPLRLPPPRFSRSPGPFVVLCGSAYRRALCSWQWRTGGPPVPVASTPLLPWGRREGAAAREVGAPPLLRGAGQELESVPRPSARGSCSVSPSSPPLPSLCRTREE